MRLKLLQELPEGSKDWDDWRANHRVMDAKTGRVKNPPKVIGVEVLDLGHSPNQHFTPEYVMKAMREGWMSMKGDVLTIHAKGGDVIYKILRTPGYYCCHDGSPQDGEQEARDYVADNFAGKESPDKSNLAGYERINYYDCVETLPRKSKE